MGRLPSADEMRQITSTLPSALVHPIESFLKAPLLDLPMTKETESIKAMSDAACLDAYKGVVASRIREEFEAELRKRIQHSPVTE